MRETEPDGDQDVADAPRPASAPATTEAMVERADDEHRDDRDGLCR